MSEKSEVSALAYQVEQQGQCENPILNKAAKTLRQLERENARLRGALEAVTRWSSESRPSYAMTALVEIDNIARAALKDADGERK